MSRSPLICVYITINIRFKDFPGPVASASYKNLDKVFHNAIKVVLDIVHCPPEHGGHVLVCSSRDRPLTSILLSQNPSQDFCIVLALLQCQGMFKDSKGTLFPVEI